MKPTLVFLVFHVISWSQCYGSRCRGVRYPRLGCFTLEPPFSNSRWLPQRPSFVNTAFQLYTRDNPTTAERLYPHQRSSLLNSSFDARRPTKFLIHGFLQYGRTDFVVNTTAALLEKAPMNVIVVAWEGGAGFPYTQAVANTRLVGAETAALIAELVRVKNVALREVHIIGHSLGAHIAGYAGARTPGLGRITALDPAQPNFSGFANEVRLDASDALFVDVIHTDGVPYDTVRGYGMIEPVGDLDFFPNAGHNQPGCREESSIVGFVEDAISYGMTTAETGLSCSHERSTELFLASIHHSASSSPHQCHFTAVPCPSYESFLRGECLHCDHNLCPVMGLDADRSRSRGNHFLNTTGSEDFCGFQYFVDLTVSDTSMTGVYGRVEVMLTGQMGSIAWTEVHDGLISPGSRLTHMILSPNDVGDLSGVKVRAHYTLGYFSWGQSQATLRKVKVASILKFATRYYCQPTMVLQEGEELVLSSGNFAESECVWS